MIVRYLRRFGKYGILMVAIFFFLLGNLVSLFFVPVTRTCVLDKIDRGYNIMDNAKLQSPDLIILILSAPANLNKRNGIRNTWLNLVNNNNLSNDKKPQLKIKHYFVVGLLALPETEVNNLQYEQSKYKDILSLPMLDKYENLTEKVIRSFGWLKDQLDVGFDFKYVLKCDDDSFVNVENLVHELIHLDVIYLKSTVDVDKIDDNSSPYITVNLQSNAETSHGNRELYWGYFKGSARIFRTGKWKETSWMLCDHYLPYAHGGGYLLTKKLIVYLAKNRENLRCYNSEDVSVGAWLAPVNNVVRIHDVRFDTEYKSRGCQNTYLIVHNISVETMKQLYTNLKTLGRLCVNEKRTRGEYLYNWDKPPSKCCDVLI